MGIHRLKRATNVLIPALTFSRATFSLSNQLVSWPRIFSKSLNSQSKCFDTIPQDVVSSAGAVSDRAIQYSSISLLPQCILFLQTLASPWNVFQIYSLLVEMSFGVKSVSDDERGLDINVHISKHTSPKHTHRDLEMMCHNLSKNIGKYQIWGSICHILNIILSCFNLPFFTTSRITPFLLLVHDITTGARTGSHPKNSCTLSCRGIRV